MTAYQSILKKHLEALFRKHDLITDTVLLQFTEKEFVIELAMNHGYCPVFGQLHDGYCSFNGIKLFGQC